MKKLIFILLIMFSTTSCATNMELRLSKEYDGIHHEFQPYVEEFIMMSDGKVSQKDFQRFSMGFRKYDISDSTVGTCHYLVHEVDISIDWWNSDKSPSERLELVFHEFGHCILNRGHTEKPVHDGFVQWLERIGFKLGFFSEKGYLHDGCPASFMHPYTIGERCINKHFAYYIKELFHNTDAMNYVELRKQHNHYTHNKCSKPMIVNKTNKWVQKDEDTLNRAKKKCVKEYKSCLKVFTKKNEGEYTALCE